MLFISDVPPVPQSVPRKLANCPVDVPPGFGRGKRDIRDTSLQGMSRVLSAIPLRAGKKEAGSGVDSQAMLPARIGPKKQDFDYFRNANRIFSKTINGFRIGTF
jgi:hypothetical protein